MDNSAHTLVRRPFLFLRHGETDWNLQRLCVGQIDRPLTELGRTQARAAGAVCKELKVSVIYCSPLTRASETASIIASQLSNVSIVSDARLMEVCLGSKQGQREDDPADPFIRYWIEGKSIQDAEPYLDLRRRVTSAVNLCLESCSENSVPLFVAHAGVYHALRDAMASPIAQVMHCVPYGHVPVGDTWKIQTYGVEGSHEN